MSLNDLKEREYEKDLLADGYFVAEGKRKLREQSEQSITQGLEENQENTLSQLLNVRYFIEVKEGTLDLSYLYPETDKEWKTIIDKEKKRIKFIDDINWTFRFKEYTEDDTEHKGNILS